MTLSGVLTYARSTARLARIPSPSMIANTGTTTIFAVMLLSAVFANVGPLTIFALAFLLTMRTNSAAFAQLAVVLALVVYA